MKGNDLCKLTDVVRLWNSKRASSLIRLFCCAWTLIGVENNTFRRVIAIPMRCQHQKVDCERNQRFDDRKRFSCFYVTSISRIISTSQHQSPRSLRGCCQLSSWYIVFSELQREKMGFRSLISVVLGNGPRTHNGTYEQLFAKLEDSFFMLNKVCFLTGFLICSDLGISASTRRFLLNVSRCIIWPVFISQ